MKKIILFIMMLTALSAEAAVTAFFKPEKVGYGESAQLVFQSDKSFNEIPNLDSLKKDFVVSGQQQRHSSSWVNGVASAQYELIYNIFPRREGVLSAGPFNVNGETVAPISLTVQSQGVAKESKVPIQISASVSPEVVYPGEAALYTVRITETDGLIDGRITAPNVPNARVTVLDRDKAWQAIENGRSVRIFERTFEIVPEKSGVLNIGEAEFYGIVPDSSAYHQKSPFDFFDQGILFNGLVSRQKEVLLTTKPLTLQVKEKPADWTGWWLPSRMVDLHITDKIPDVIHVGDPIERTMTLTALGVSAEQLPTIVQASGKGVQVYPSPETRETTRDKNGDILGKEVASVIIVPENAGELVIPEVRIPWFNVQTQQKEWAVVPPKKIIVEGGAVVSSVQKENKEPMSEKVEVESPRQEHFSDLKEKMPGLYWIMTLIGVGIILGFLVALVVVGGNKKPKTTYNTSSKKTQDKKKKQGAKKKPLPELYPF